MPGPDDLPDARQDEGDDPELTQEPPDLELGPPFAMAAGCDMQEATAVVRCDSCGTRFKINLLKSGYAQCPGGTCTCEYTYALLVGDADDVGLAGDFVRHVFEHNGLVPEGDDREPNPDDPEDVINAPADEPEPEPGDDPA